MKKFLLVLMSALSVLLLAGCQQAPSDTPNNEEVALVEESEEDLNFIGSWTRVSLVVGGSPIEQTPTVMTLNSDHTYTSVGSCATSGKYDIATEGNGMTMVISTTNCYGTSAGQSASYSYSVSEDGKTLTTTTGNSVETFTKNS